MADIKFEIVQSIGCLSESSNGWTKELNMISWNDVYTVSAAKMNNDRRRHRHE